MRGRERTRGCPARRVLSLSVARRARFSWPHAAYTPSVKGTFITLEGPEGAGKTVLAKRLVAELERRGRVVRSTREPGGTRLGERLRSILLEHGAEGEAAIVARADALLFNAARAQLVAEVIRPALERGEVVICARFADSTLAYQGYGAGLPLDELRAIAEVATGGLTPDLTILLDVPSGAGPPAQVRRVAQSVRGCVRPRRSTSACAPGSSRSRRRSRSAGASSTRRGTSTPSSPDVIAAALSIL